MNIRDYITGTQQVLAKEGDASVVLTRLKHLLETRGLQKYYIRILRGLLQKIEQGERSTVPHVILARTEDEARYTEEIKKAIAQISTSNTYKTHIDTSIIGGFIVKGKDARVDQSYKNTLLQAYHRVTD